MTPTVKGIIRDNILHSPEKVVRAPSPRAFSLVELAPACADNILEI